MCPDGSVFEALLQFKLPMDPCCDTTSVTVAGEWMDVFVEGRGCVGDFSVSRFPASGFWVFRASEFRMASGGGAGKGLSGRAGGGFTPTKGRRSCMDVGGKYRTCELFKPRAIRDENGGG